MKTEPKTALYAELHSQLDAVLEGIQDDVTMMSTAACLIHHSLAVASWTGFYRVVAPNLLRVGPYQGPLGCLEIAFDRGVCGAAARSRQTQLVPDVHEFPGHVACDVAARSEIVIPVFRGDDLIAVLDVDSHQPAAFDEVDQAGLEEAVQRLQSYLDP